MMLRLSALLFLVGCATKNIQGTVLDSNGHPLSNATITLANQVTHTNIKGIYEIGEVSLKEGDYVIFITHEDHIFTQTSQRIAGKNVVLTPIQLEPIQVEVPYPEIPLESIIGD